MSAIEVQYNGNPDHQRAYSVTADSIEVKSIPLVFLNGQGIEISEEYPEDIEAYGRVLQQAFAKVFANVDVAGLKAEAEKEHTSVIPVGRRGSRTITAKDPFAGFHLQCEFDRISHQAYPQLGFYGQKPSAPALQVA